MRLFPLRCRVVIRGGERFLKRGRIAQRRLVFLQVQSHWRPRLVSSVQRRKQVSVILLHSSALSLQVQRQTALHGLRRAFVSYHAEHQRAD